MSDPLAQGKKALAALAALNDKHAEHMAKHKAKSAELAATIAACRAEYEDARRADPEAMPDFGIAVNQ